MRTSGSRDRACCRQPLTIRAIIVAFVVEEYMFFLIFFFFNDTATTEIYTLSLHDALPIFAKLYCENSGPEKTGTITYALNLTQHTNGVQNIRALCMLQILLGNIGRPGGGVVALRGHANVQGATDLEVLYHELPGYLPMPLRDAHPDLKTYLEKVTPKGGFWVNLPKFMVSLLKAFYGDAAKVENDYGYQWLPKRASADAYSHQHIFVDMYKGVIKGFLADGQNPAVGGPNAKLARAALGKLDWLVVKDIFVTETAEFWKAPRAVAKDIKTEVFFLAAAPAAEHDGRLTHTSP